MYEFGGVTVRITDMDRAVKFYTEVLGFQLQQRDANRWALLSGPGLTLTLHPGLFKGVPVTDRLSIALYVQDLDAEIQRLEGLGVKVERMEDEDSGFGFFSDPDRNPLYLCRLD